MIITLNWQGAFPQDNFQKDVQVKLMAKYEKNEY